MFKRILSILLLAALVTTLFTGCMLGKKSINMDQLQFSINGKTCKYLVTLNELLAGGNVQCKVVSSTKRLEPNKTDEVSCTFKVNNVTQTVKVTVWNNTKNNLKIGECVVKGVRIHGSQIAANAQASIMGTDLDQGHEIFEGIFGKYDTKVDNKNSSVYTWKRVPIKDANYLVTAIFTESFNDMSREYSEINVFIEPLEE